MSKLLISVTVICLIGFFAVVFFALNNKNEKEAIILPKDTKVEEQTRHEEEAIKEANQNVLNEARQQIIEPVRAIDESDHYQGNIDAPVQIIIYSDFECPFLPEFNKTIKQVKQEFGDKVVIAFRHFILNTHFNIAPAALASECAAEQGKFWEMYDKLSADNEAQRINIEQFKKDAAEIGLDTVKFNKCLDTEKYKDKIYAQMLEGRNAGITGTPGNFINKEPFPGAYPFEDFIRSNGEEAEGMKSIIEGKLEENK